MAQDISRLLARANPRDPSKLYAHQADAEQHLMRAQSKRSMPRCEQTEVPPGSSRSDKERIFKRHKARG
jgi:hypothetical protein